MSIKLIQERYLNEFEFYYKSNGYRFSKKIFSFVKDEFEIFVGASATFMDSISLMPSFKVNNKTIQSILERVYPNEIGLCTYYRVQSMNFAFECGIIDDKITYSPFNSLMPGETNPNILSIGNYRYMIELRTDLIPILEDHKYFMEKVTFPLFDKMSTLEGIDNFLNGRILEGDMAYFMSYNRQQILKKLNQKREILSGLIAAKLINNPNFENLLIRIRTMWEGNSYILDDVDKLMLYFDKE